MNKRKISKVLYWTAILISISNFIAILAIHWSFILSGKGVGSFAVLWAVSYGLVSGAFWIVAFLLDKNRNLSIFYWVTILAPSILFFIQPVSFYIE